MKSSLDAHALSRITHLRIMGLSYPKIASQMGAENWPTVQGGSWYPNTVRQYCQQASKRLREPTARPSRSTDPMRSEAPPVLRRRTESGTTLALRPDAAQLVLVRLAATGSDDYQPTILTVHRE